MNSMPLIRHPEEVWVHIWEAPFPPRGFRVGGALEQGLGRGLGSTASHAGDLWALSKLDGV